MQRYWFPFFALLSLLPFPPAHAEDSAIPGFAIRDGAYRPLEPYIEGQPRATGLQLAWPAMPSADTNPVSPEKVELGKLLFFDPIVSGKNDMSCATCHHPDLGFSDGRVKSMGFGGQGFGPARSGGHVIRRNTPTVWNAAYNHLQFWDGRAKDLEEQANGPITSPDEMGETPENLVNELRAIPAYVQHFERAFGGAGPDSVTYENARKAIGSFERTILSFNSRFDRYTQGDMNALNEEEKRGMRLFRSVKTRCFECHRFPTFADPTFRVIGVPPVDGDVADEGRGEVAPGEPLHAFKVPTLRNVELTAPYMHNGVFKSLEEVIDFYAQGGGHQFPKPVEGIDDKIGKFTLLDSEKADLVSFLKALTDTSLQPDPPASVPSGLPVIEVKSRAIPATAVPVATSLDTAQTDSQLLKPPTPPQPRLAMQDTVFTYQSANRPPVSAPTQLPIGIIISVGPGRSIQAAIDRAQPGDRVEVLPGVYNEMLVVDKPGIQLVGVDVAGDRPILDGQGTMADAVQVSGDDFHIEGFTIRNYTGNGCTVSKTKNVVFRNLICENTGVYGVYPVECQGVLVENCVVSGINDAGIYVGQSQDIVVRNNEVFKNVAGIEIENSVNVIVTNNSCHHNAAGMLVFVLPNNPSKEGRLCLVSNNRIWENNGPNFGKPGTIVESLPSGVGLIVMGADNTRITNNLFEKNDTYALTVISLLSANLNRDFGATLDVEPNSDRTLITRNTYRDNGNNPSERFKIAFPGVPGGDLLWDGKGTGNTWHEEGDLRTVPADLLKTQAAG